MTKRFYLTGQRTFGNRGCEAIVRSTVMMLKRKFGDVQVLVPSEDIERDQQQWPEASDYGVSFVEAYLPQHNRYWTHLQRLPFKFLKQAVWPFGFPSKFRKQIESLDAVLSIGGDNYSLDYHLPSLLMGQDGLAMQLGKPVFIWGASVGPFDAEPHFVPVMRQHLSRMSAIFARENISYTYLTEKLGLMNVVKMTDPAFTLQKEKVDMTEFWPKSENGQVIGLNISPLIEKYKKDGQDLRLETIKFIANVVHQGFGVLLIPHVIPLDGNEKNNDAIYMTSMLQDLRNLGKSVNIMPSHFNAAQIKQVISQLNFFMGARTHATIAALSSGVPTLSISYSVKAKGINQDLLGDMDVVLPTPELTSVSLMNGLSYLIEHEQEIKQILSDKLPEWQARVEKAAEDVMQKVQG
ncbi:MAG: polysaccharide pyruvyl transferase family protein [Methyloprofundus sp.]|nr:polysaccharide pyruvyl transferase family protein [Methyloprofundus sp.]